MREKQRRKRGRRSNILLVRDAQVTFHVACLLVLAPQEQSIYGVSLREVHISARGELKHRGEYQYPAHNTCRGVKVATSAQGNRYKKEHVQHKRRGITKKILRTLLVNFLLLLQSPVSFGSAAA